MVNHVEKIIESAEKSRVGEPEPQVIFFGLMKSTNSFFNNSVENSVIERISKLNGKFLTWGASDNHFSFSSSYLAVVSKETVDHLARY